MVLIQTGDSPTDVLRVVSMWWL